MLGEGGGEMHLSDRVRLLSCLEHAKKTFVADFVPGRLNFRNFSFVPHSARHLHVLTHRCTRDPLQPTPQLI